MSDSQVQRAVREFDDPRLYVKKSGVGLFDSHEEEGFIPERDDKGNIVKDEHGKPKGKKVVHKFDKKTLDKIAKRCNERDAAGDFCPITIGHTLKDPQAPEKDQPEPVGVARNWRTEWDQPHGKWMLKADFYIKADRYQEAKTYPRTSIELWPESLEVDPVAIIRRTPQRDCGSWVYSRSNHSYSRQLARFCPRLGRHVTVLQYARDFSEQEKSMADMPNLEREDTAPELSHEEKLHQFAKHVFSHPHAMELAKHYAAGMDDEEAPIGTPSATPSEEEPEPIQNAAQPSASNGDMPKPVERAGTGGDEVQRMQRDKEAIQYSRVMQELAAARKEMEAIREEKRQDALRYARSESEKVAQQLVYEGFDIDIAEEVERMAPMTPEARQKHAEYVRKYHRQSPVAPAPFVGRRDSITPPMGNGADEDTSKARHEMEVLKFQRQHKGMTYDQAEEELARRKSGTNGTATRN